MAPREINHHAPDDRGSRSDGVGCGLERLADDPGGVGGDGPFDQRVGAVADPEPGAVGHPGGDLAPEDDEHRQQDVVAVEEADLAEGVDHGGQLGQGGGDEPADVVGEARRLRGRSGGRAIDRPGSRRTRGRFACCGVGDQVSLLPRILQGWQYTRGIL